MYFLFEIFFKFLEDFYISFSCAQEIQKQFDACEHYFLLFRAILLRLYIFIDLVSSVV